MVVLEDQNIFFETYGLRVVKALRRIIRAVDIHSRKLNTDFKITAPQMLCLYTLVQKGPQTLSALAREINLSMSTTTGIADRLEAKNYITRQRSSHDRRNVLFAATQQGCDAAASAPCLLQEQLAKSLIKLGELEQATIALSLERVVELMEAEHLDDSPIMQ